MAVTAVLTVVVGSGKTPGVGPVVVHLKDSTLGAGRAEQHRPRLRLKTVPEGYTKDSGTDPRPAPFGGDTIEIGGLNPNADGTNQWLQSWTIIFDDKIGGSFVVEGQLTDELGNVSTAETTVNVNGAAGTAYYVSLAGNNGSAGTSEGAAWATPAHAFATAANGSTIYFRAGDTFDLVTAHALTDKQFRVDRYGAGANPIIRNTGDVDVINFNDDCRITWRNVEWHQSDTTPTANGAECRATAEGDYYFYGIAFSATDDPLIGIDVDGARAVACVACNFTGLTQAATFANAAHLMLVVNTITALTSAGNMGIRIYDTVEACTLIGNHGQGTADANDIWRVYPQWLCMNRNYVVGSDATTDYTKVVQIGWNDSGLPGAGTKYRITQNYFYNASLVLNDNGNDWTVHSNIIYRDVLSGGVSISERHTADAAATLDRVVFRYNTMIGDAAFGSGEAFFTVNTMTTQTITNFTFQDNLLVHGGAAAMGGASRYFYRNREAGSTGAGAVTRNVYYAADMTGSQFENEAGGGQTLAQWQALNADVVGATEKSEAYTLATFELTFRPTVASHPLTTGGGEETPDGIHDDAYGNPLPASGASYIGAVQAEVLASGSPVSSSTSAQWNPVGGQKAFGHGY